MTHGALLLQAQQAYSQKLELADPKAWGFRVAARETDDPPSDSTSSQTQVSGRKAGLESSFALSSFLSSWYSYGRGWRIRYSQVTFTSASPEGKVSALLVLLKRFCIVLKVLLGRGWRVTWETSQYLAYFMQEAFWGVLCGC